MQAVDIFKELGWEEITPEKVLTQKLGTSEQRKVLLDGLKSGAWGEISQKSENTYGWKCYFDVDQHSLALLAIRVGVTARRAANLPLNVHDPVLVEVIGRRGKKFALDLISYGCVSRHRMSEHSTSRFGKLAVRLVDRLSLEIPQSAEYIKDWSVYAAVAMGLPAETLYHETDLPDIAMIKKRFGEHIRVGIAVNAPATGPFGRLFPEGVLRGYMSKEEGIGLIFSALDASVRPADRKVWLQALDKLGISDQELYSRTQMLIPLLSSGEPAVVERIAPVLIAGADSDMLGEVLVSSLCTSVKKAKQLVLRSAMEKPCPSNVSDVIFQLSALTRDKNKITGSLATQLMKKWNLQCVMENTKDPVPVKNLWQPTPPVWKAPVFDIGEASPENLTDLAAEVVGRSVFIHDLMFERLLAMSNAIAWKIPGEARISLGGLRSEHEGLYQLYCWVNQSDPVYGFDCEKDGEARTKALLDARDYIVCSQLDRLPCLLSTPSMADLSVSVSDLAKRLALYQETDTKALEADLFLAMTRLDNTTKTTRAVEELQKLKVPVALQTGETMKKTAAQLVLAYLDDMIKEPGPATSGWRPEIFDLKVLKEFPPRLESYYGCDFFSIFPTWGDAALKAVCWDCEVYHEQGLVLRQAARRKAPLPPGAAINFLAARRSASPKAAADAALAVTEAWQRGLLRPGLADIDLLDWRAEQPSNLAALAKALEDIAREGMLSVVWPVLDSVIEKSLKAPRLLAGTAEFVELAAGFLPEVRSAIEKGLADPSNLYLPGIRTLAKRGGTSRSVTAAKEIVALLPKWEEGDNHETEPDLLPFEDVWKVQKNVSSLIEDGVTITVEKPSPETRNKMLSFILKLPQIADKSFVIVKSWFYDLEHEGQCQAYEVPIGKNVYDCQKNSVYLYWDLEKKAMAVSRERNRTNGDNRPLKGIFPQPPLPLSILTVLIGLTAQDGEAAYFAPRLLRKFIEEGKIGADLVHRATCTLLRSPAVSPAKLMRLLEQDASLLSALWPMLTECVKFAGGNVSAGEAPPVWVNRVIALALRYTPYLKEAAARGLIPAEALKWPGLLEIAKSKAKSASVAKAKQLLNLWQADS